MFPSIRSNSRCVVLLPSYLMSYTAILLIDVIYLKHGGGTLLPSDIHTHRTYTKQAHHHVHALPSVRKFPALTFCFRCFTFSELCGDNSRALVPPTVPPSQQGHRKVTASVTHQPSLIICRLVSQNRGS